MSKNQIELIVNNQDIYELNQSKILIGSSDKCDIVLEGLSHYHLFIELDSNYNMSVIDLNSNAGTYINGSKLLAPTPLAIDDTLTIGAFHCNVILSINPQVLELIDAKLTSVIEEEVYIPEKQDINSVLIDNEYCDIIFNEIDLNSTPKPIIRFEADSFVEPVELIKPYDIVSKANQKSLSITTTINGNIIDVSYLAFKDSTWSASGTKDKKSVFIDILETSKSDFIVINGEGIEINAPEGFSLSNRNLNVQSREEIVLSSGDYQIFISVSDSPAHINKIPMFSRDKEFVKDSSKVFALFLPLLFLLLVDISLPKKVKKVSIIYKKQVSTKKSNKNVAKAGAKQTKKVTKPVKKVATKKIQKPKKMEKVSKTKPQKKVAIKSYEFKMDSNMKNIFSKTKAAKVDTKNREISSFQSSSLATNTESKNSKAGKGATGIGSGLANAQNDYGANGLKMRDGKDSAFIETETVIMGSIDPELLRKILQQYLPQFRHCYQQELSYNSEDIKGIVDLNFEISSVGSVQKIAIKAKDSRFSKKGIDCMGTVLGIISFPKPKGGGRVSVRQPLNFFAETQKS